MKCISLLQPYASLVVWRHKKIETRSWNTKYRGELLIHASAGKQGIKTVLDAIPTKETELFLKHIPNLYALPFGAIIGQVNLSGTSKVEAIDPLFLCNIKFFTSIEDWHQEKVFGDYSSGRYGWYLQDAIQFDTPIPAKGSLGIWEYNEKTAKGLL